MAQTNKHILIADDLPTIHEDFAKILAPRDAGLSAVSGLAKFAPALAADGSEPPAYGLAFVSQGEEAIRAVSRARAEGRPFAVVFLDVRMPPGIDGVETAERLMALDPTLQIVLCTAYADYSFSEISRRFRASSNFLILKKPFDPAEVLQVAHALCRKWTLDEENQRLIHSLEAKVRERTRDLERKQEELAQALKLAHASARAKRAFLNSVSHELYTPLNGISMGAALIRDSGDQEVAQLSQVISEASERLQRLFRRVLLYTGLENAPPGERLQPVDVGGVIEQLRAHYAKAAETKGLGWTIETTLGSGVYLHGEPEHFSQLLDLLVENAFKFTDKGSVSLRLEIIEGPALRIVVRDSGPGLKSDLASMLREPFEPGDSSTTRKHDGLGLGLNLADRLVDHFHGSWWHAKPAGGGAEFTVVLPAAG